MLGIIENTDTQKRQYIDAESVFEELRRVRKEGDADAWRNDLA